MADTDVPLRNHLLAALPENEYARLSAHLERVWLSPGEVLHESGRPLQHVYFPTTAIVSLLYIMEDGAAAASNRRSTPLCISPMNTKPHGSSGPAQERYRIMH